VSVIDNFKYVFDVNIPKELINLMEIPGMTRKCAKILFEDLHITNSNDLITMTNISITKIIDAIVLKIGFELQDIDEMEKKIDNYENNNNNTTTNDTNINNKNNNETNNKNNNNETNNYDNNGESFTKVMITRLRVEAWVRFIINEAK
jgi:DNA replication protein DnaD